MVVNSVNRLQLAQLEILTTFVICLKSKSMKKSALFITFMAILGLSFTSCSKDDNESRYLSYTTVYDAVAKTLMLDSDSSLLVAEEGSEILGSVNWVDRKRLILDYTVLRTQVNGSKSTHYVKINNYYSVLTKAPRYKSLLTTEANDSIGTDPINLYGVWFANDYMNINFGIYRNNPYITHYINLVIDDTKTTGDEIYAELRHNAYADFTYRFVQGNVSFDMQKLLTPPRANVKIYLTRKTYTSGVKTDTLTYTGGNVSSKSVINNPPSSLN